MILTIADHVQISKTKQHHACWAVNSVVKDQGATVGLQPMNGDNTTEVTTMMVPYLKTSSIGGPRENKKNHTRH